MSDSKRRLRQDIKRKINALDIVYCQEADRKIHDKVIQLPEYENAKCIFCFVGTVDEINTTPIIEHALDSGKCVAVPVCISKGIMESYVIKSLEELQSGSYGIMEPDIKLSEKIEPSRIDLAIVPCLSANSKGQRIGYGGGFYDRYLMRTDAYRMVLCREKIMCGDIPVEEHDLKMDMVVSEERVIR